MAGIVPTLTNGSFHNWLKGALGVLFAKEGLTEFVSTEFTELHKDLLNSVSASHGIPAGTTCNSCTTANLLKCHTQGFCNPGHCKIHDPTVPEKIPNQPCPNRICGSLMKAIRKKHRYKCPSWKNTDACRWCKDPFEVAKCYLPPDGYFDIHSFEETDFNGILSVIINNRRFQSKLAAQLNTDTNNCTKARDIGKAVRHSPDLLLTDADLAQYITDLINVLTDPTYLASDLKALAAVNKLKELQANTLTIHANDITNVIHDNIGRSISTQHQAVLQDIQKHLSDVKTASIYAIDKLITAKLTALDEIRKETELKKTEINVHTVQKKQDFDEHAGLLKKSINVIGDQKKQDIDVHADHKKQDIDKLADHKKQNIDVHADQKKQDIGVYIYQKKQDIDVHADHKKQDIDKHVDQKKQDIEVHINQKKQDIDKHVDQKKQDIEVHINQNKKDIGMHADQKKQDIDVHADQKKQDIEVHADKKMQNIDFHADKKKQDIDVHVDQKKQDIDVNTDQKKLDIDMHADEKIQDIDIHADKKKQDIDMHADQKKQDIDVHADQKKQDIDVHAEQKTQDIERNIDQKKQDVELHANQKKEDIDLHANQMMQDIEIHADQKRQDIDLQANQMKQDIEIHADQRKQDMDVHANQKMHYLDVYIDRNKQDIDMHADQKKQDIDVHADQKKQDIDVHADQKKQDIEVHADQMKQDIDMHADQKKQDLDMYTDQKKHEIAVLGGQEIKTGSQIKEEEYAGFQSELIKMYRKHNTKIPLSPLAEEHDVPLVDLYVEPPMSAIDLQQWRGDQQGDPVKTPVNGYKELLFFHGENAFKNIYITANAGVGKTSFSSHLCMTWCQAHDPKENLTQHFRTENLQALKCFEFVFLISLREAQRSVCDVDKFICELVQNRLPNIKVKTSCELVDDILSYKSCLIILDGLDEWVHPTCKRSHKKSDIPHAKCWSGSTIVTTSRPWKFDVIRLPSSKVDRHVEIRELDRKSSRRLIINAIKLLNERSASNKPEMKIADFDQATSGLNLGNLSDNPYINLQIVSLWHDGENIGRSKIEIFTNIVELTLERGLAKHGPGPISAVTPVICNKPKCLICRDKCHKHFALLYNLGKLAFFALFGIEQESALVIDKSVALQYLDSEEELDFCLKLGLLSQNKDYRFVSRRQSKVSFQHKTFHEYFSALYIQSDIESKNARKHILKKCNSLESVLEMSNMFVFLCGMNPEVYKRMFKEIIQIVPTDSIVRSYRSSPNQFYKVKLEYKKVFAFQTLQTDCMQEIKNNGHSNCFPPIEDVIIDAESKNEEYLSSLETIIRNHCIKSITIRDTEVTECTKIVDRLNIRSCHTLERLCLCSAVKRDDLEHLLKQNLKTLRYLEVFNVIYRDNRYFNEMTSLSRKCLAHTTNMPYLHYLYLDCFSMRHNELKDMFDYITNRSIMTGISLFTFQCEDHVDCCSGFILNLSRHVHLRSLGLHKVRIHQLHVNTERLENCVIGQLPAGVASSWLRKIAGSPMILWCASLAADDLSALTEILPTLLHLEGLDIRKLSLVDLRLPISPEMNSLQYVGLYRVSLNCSVLRGLVDSVSRLAQPVAVTLRYCTVTPPEEYEFMKTEIRTSKTFHVQFDGMNEFKHEEFRFIKL